MSCCAGVNAGEASRPIATIAITDPSAKAHPVPTADHHRVIAKRGNRICHGLKARTEGVAKSRKPAPSTHPHTHSTGYLRFRGRGPAIALRNSSASLESRLPAKRNRADSRSLASSRAENIVRPTCSSSEYAARKRTFRSETTMRTTWAFFSSRSSAVITVVYAGGWPLARCWISLALRPSGRERRTRMTSASSSPGPRVRFPTMSTSTLTLQYVDQRRRRLVRYGRCGGRWQGRSYDTIVSSSAPLDPRPGTRMVELVLPAVAPEIRISHHLLQ